MHVISSLPSPSCRHHLRERRLGVPPRDERLVDEADRLADAEAPVGVVARRRRDRAAAHARQRLPIAAAFSLADRAGEWATSAASAVCWLRDGTTTTCFSDSSAARSAAMITLALLGSTTTSSAGTAWMPRAARRSTGSSSGRRGARARRGCGRARRCRRSRRPRARRSVRSRRDGASRAPIWVCMSATSTCEISPEPATGGDRRARAGRCERGSSACGCRRRRAPSRRARRARPRSAPSPGATPVTAKFVQ